MTKSGGKATAALVAALVMVAGRASAQHEPSVATNQSDATIVLHVANHAALPPHVLDGAKARVAKVYEVIGVRIVWVDGEEPVAPRQDGWLHLHVVLLSLDMVQKIISAERLTDRVLGLAYLRIRRAYIFCDNIATVPGVRTLYAIPLGNVIAHEVGHLLLQANSHSDNGIMRADVDLHAIHLENFDNTQVRTIRNTLMAVRAGATVR